MRRYAITLHWRWGLRKGTRVIVGKGDVRFVSDGHTLREGEWRHARRDEMSPEGRKDGRYDIMPCI